MKVSKIHSMRWGNEARQSVILRADTDTGMNEEIATPYNADSIIWDAVQTFPADQIEAFVPPPPAPDSATDVNVVTDVTPR